MNRRLTRRWSERPHSDGTSTSLRRRVWYGEPNAVINAIAYAKFRSRAHDAVIRAYDEAGNVIETHEHAGEFKEW